MLQKSVVSSNIQAIGHDGANTLYIRFNSGTTYEYAGAPFSVYENLVDAESVGKAFHRDVRGKYPHKVCLLSPLAA